MPFARHVGRALRHRIWHTVENLLNDRELYCSAPRSPHETAHPRYLTGCTDAAYCRQIHSTIRRQLNMLASWGQRKKHPLPSNALDNAKAMSSKKYWLKEITLRTS